MQWLIIFVVFTVSCSTTQNLDSAHYYERGNELAKDGLFRESAQSYRKALKKRPRLVQARRNLGIVQVKLKDYGSAIKNLEHVIQKFDTDFETNYWLAEAYRSQDRNADAIFRYKKALSIKPQELKAQKALAWTYYQVRYYSEALSLSQAIVNEYPKDLQAVLIVARTLIKINQSQNALQLIEKSRPVATEINLPYLQSVEGDAYVAQNRCSDAIRVYRDALKVQPLLPGPLYGLGQCYFSLGKNTEGLSYLERAVKIKPDFTEAVYALAKAYESSKDPRALPTYKRFRKLAAKDPEFLERLADVQNKIKSAKVETKNQNLK